MKSHFEREKDTLKQLLQLENEFRDHFTLTQCEVQAQKEILDRLWILSQRYMILIRNGPCCKHPEIYSTPTEDVILQEFNDKLKYLHLSNCRIKHSLNMLRQSCRVFEDLCSQLDMSIESSFILGDTFHKPISFFIELVSDLFKYFHAMVLKLNYHARQLEPDDSSALEEYKKLLEPSEDFEEYLKTGLMYCKCLRPKPHCPDPKSEINL